MKSILILARHETILHGFTLRKVAFILQRNAAALPIYRSFIYHSSTERTALQVKMNAVPQCSSWSRDGNMSTATYRNAEAVEYEQSLTHEGPRELSGASNSIETEQ